MSPADKVLLTLILREQESVCVPVAELAEETELSEGQVRRALRELRQDERIIPMGKRGNATVWCFPDEDPGARSATVSPERRFPEGGTAGPGGQPVERLAEPSADPEPVAEEENTEELRRIGLSHLYGLLDRFGEEDELGPPDQPGGECGECGTEARGRYALGLFLLCRDCRVRRQRAALKVDDKTPGPPREGEFVRTPAASGTLADELTGKAVDALLETHHRNGDRADESWIDSPEIDY